MIIMEVAPHQDGRCLECRMIELEQWLAALSALIGWTLIAAAGYLAWRRGWLKGLIDV